CPGTGCRQVDAGAPGSPRAERPATTFSSASVSQCSTSGAWLYWVPQASASRPTGRRLATHQRRLVILGAAGAFASGAFCCPQPGLLGGGVARTPAATDEATATTRPRLLTPTFLLVCAVGFLGYAHLLLLGPILPL